MVPVKIECDCGQHYAFDIEPLNGQMPSMIACPDCGADGTPAANAIISRSLSLLAPVEDPHSIKPAPHLVAPAPEPATLPKSIGYSGRQLGLVGRKQAEVEARAKVSWGDSQDTVIRFLMMQGYQHREASDLAAVMFKERRVLTRANGIRKTIIGSCLIGVAVTAWVVFSHLDELTARIVIRFVVVALLIGCVGLWHFVNGMILLLVPGLDKNDVTEQ